MATRRPNVPRVSPAARTPAALKDPGQGAEVIRGNFRTGGHGSAGKAPVTAPAVRPPKDDVPDRSGLNRPASDRPGPDRQSTSAPATDRTATGAGGGKTQPGTGRGDTSRETSGNSAPDQGEQPPAAGSYPDVDQRPVPAKAFSGRMLALAVVMIAITVMLAPTVKIFIDKSAEISELNADIATKEAEQAALNQQISRWQDPNYVKQQARDRINMVMPGETSYWVYGSEVPAETLPAESGAAGGAGAAGAEDLPWVDALWESVRRSGTE